MLLKLDHTQTQLLIHYIYIYLIKFFDARNFIQNADSVATAVKHMNDITIYIYVCVMYVSIQSQSN